MSRLAAALVCLVVPVTLLSCNAIEAPSDPGQTTTVTQNLITPPPTPTLQPTMPFKAGSTLFPSTVKSAYLVTLRDPSSSRIIYAYGFDVVAGTNVFVIQTTIDEQRAVVNQVQLDIARWKLANSGSSLWNGGADGEGVKKVGGGGPAPHGGKAWALAVNHHQVDLDIQLTNP